MISTAESIWRMCTNTIPWAASAGFASGGTGRNSILRSAARAVSGSEGWLRRATGISAGVFLQVVDIVVLAVPGLNPVRGFSVIG